MTGQIARRRVLAGLLASVLAAPKSSLAQNRAYDRCVTNLTGPDIGSPLTIDVHCHVFNGYDIPVKNFVQRIVLNSDEGGDLSHVGGFSASQFVRLLLFAARSDTYELSKLDRVFGTDDHLKAVCRWYSRRQTGDFSDLPPSKITQDFARFFTQNRTFNALDLMTIYPAVHLFTPALVDLYAGAGPARSNYVNQLEISERICRATAGRMHFFAAFDPLRQALHDRHPDAGYMDQLELVKRAVESRGFIGVKLYPPMGFSPVGNSKRACPPAAHPLFARTPSAAAYRQEFGDLFDAALEKLFSWAEANDVPIMAHAAGSNFSNRACAVDNPDTADNESANFNPVRSDYYLGNASQWQEVLATHSKLRVNLAHFDHEDVHLSKKGNGLTTVAGQLRDLAGKFENLYLDFSHFDAIGLADTRAGLTKLLDDPNTDPSGVLANRLMYGSDWHMLARVRGHEFYLARLRASVPQKLASGLFGQNAMRFLGLETGKANRDRLDAYYKKHQMPPPIWMQLLA